MISNPPNIMESKTPSNQITDYKHNHQIKQQYHHPSNQKSLYLNCTHRESHTFTPVNQTNIHAIINWGNLAANPLLIFFRRSNSHANRLDSPLLTFVILLPGPIHFIWTQTFLGCLNFEGSVLPVTIEVRVPRYRKFLLISILSLRSTKHRLDHNRPNSFHKMVLLPYPTVSNWIQIAATRNVKAIRPLLDRVLVSRIKSEAVPIRPNHN